MIWNKFYTLLLLQLPLLRLRTTHHISPLLCRSCYPLHHIIRQ
jgi:hypothetical protein